MNTIGTHPAYPFDPSHDTFRGLTKREYFAALAMQGLIAQANNNSFNNKYTVDDGWIDPDIVASCAVEIADALIEQLNEKDNEINKTIIPDIDKYQSGIDPY
jgi:hypothetical protein